MSSCALEELEPRLVWARFAELTQIARPPKDEDGVREHVVAWADERGLASAVDEAGNVVVRVPASAGRELAPAVVLQAHLDMVCERDPDSPYDPREGRIHVVRDDDWVLAEGTTLGADNGIGVAGAMAVTEDAELSHGPLELLLTVSEEQGLAGAKAVDPALVTGRLLVNLDGTSDGVITVGCAGSIHTFTRLRLHAGPAPAGHVALAVQVSGALGGHSGGDIAKGRANAIKALGRVLSHANEQASFQLARLEGGVSRNALPRDARAAVALEGDAEPAFRAAAEQELARLREQHAGSDDGLALLVERVEHEPAADEHTTSVALDLLAALPSGVVAMSPDLPGAVETSTSLNVATTKDGVLTLASMTRSANAPALDDVAATIQGAARLAGAEVEIVRSYPPWRPDLDSRLLGTAGATYERLFGSVPRLEVVHGGLECAVIGGKLPGVEMISMGPEIVGPHAPGERLSISGTQRFYRLLGALLDDLSS
jgi:dipeptidase D